MSHKMALFLKSGSTYYSCSNPRDFRYQKFEFYCPWKEDVYLSFPELMSKAALAFSVHQELMLD